MGGFMLSTRARRWHRSRGSLGGSMLYLRARWGVLGASHLNLFLGLSRTSELVLHSTYVEVPHRRRTGKSLRDLPVRV